jgi:subtilisin family serine protease
MLRRLLALLIFSTAVHAQVRLPGLPGPALPLGSLAVPRVDPSVAAVAGQTTSLVQDVRREAGDLIRRNRAALEADPNGYAIVRGEILMYSPTDTDLAAAQAADYSVVRIRELAALNARLVVLRAPARMATRRALTRLRTLTPTAQLDFNHLYLRSGTQDTTAASSGEVTSAPAPKPVSASASGGSSETSASGKLGLIDGGVDVRHPVFKDVAIHQYGCGGTQVIDPHGTEVASLLVGRSPEFRGAATGAELYAADVYCGAPTGGAVDAIADALAWLASERVAVINVSLVGPANATLGAVIQAMIDHGHLIVAAVGNDGPSAPPLYPASYPGVIGVTAVDKNRRVLVEAARGPQVKFAAPGADMTAAKSPRGFSLVRGTSFAAPIVAGLLSNLLHEPNKSAAAVAVTQLAHQAVDLGAPGPDPIYGFGLVGDGLAPEPGLARL